MAFSTQRSVSDGTLQDLLLEIKYIDREDILVFVADVPQVVDVDYEWITATLLRFTAPVPDSLEVLIRRATKLANVLNIFTLGASFNNPTMDENFRQMLYIAQEAREGATLEEVFNDVNMHGFKVINLGAGTQAGDAINYQQYVTDSLGAGNARINAEAARDAAITARNAAEGFAATTGTHVTNASNSAASAAASAVTATAAVTGIDASVLEAAGHADDAEDAADLAGRWASEAEDVPVTVGPDKFSAYHWAQKAADTVVTVDDLEIRVDALDAKALTRATSQTASGTAVQFLDIPTGTRRITITLNGVSTTGTSVITVQLGDSGGFETTGYQGIGFTASGSFLHNSLGFNLSGGNTAALLWGGAITLTNASGNTWVVAGNLGASASNYIGLSGGAKTLSDVLDRVRVTTNNGTDQFDAGSINILYEG